VLAPIFKLCFRSSDPFIGVFDLGAPGAPAPVGRRDPPVLLSLLLLSAMTQVPCLPRYPLVSS
jgi:hypothetical protein